MKTLTTMQLSAHLATFEACTIASLKIQTIPKLTVKSRKDKTPLPFKGVVKHSYLTVQIGASYENSVNNRLAKEGKEADFEAKERKWGSHVGDSPLISHDGNFYLHYRVLQRLSSHYFDESGKEIPRAALLDYLPLERNSGRQGTDDAVIVVSTKIENIKEIRIAGEEYTITDNPANVAIVA